MDHHSSGTNWGSTALITTFTAVTTIKNDSLRGGADGSDNRYNTKENCL